MSQRVPGDVIEQGGKRWRVIKVGDCGLLAVPVSVEPVTITDKVTGKSRTFTPHGQALQFSDESPLAP